jgi:triphosphatase
MAIEIELKYSLLNSEESVSPEQIKSKICQLFTKQKLTFVHQEKQLSNHYFDTSDLSLRNHKIALRTRGTVSDGGTTSYEQTIKTSGTVIAGLHQRPEYNVNIQDDKPILALFPNSIWQTSKGLDVTELQQNIIELFSTNFTRHTWLITLADAQVEVAFDSGEVACQDFDIKPRIFEIELELVTGDAKALFSLTKILFSELALRPGQLTKAARGYALYHQSIEHCNRAKNKTVNVSKNTSKQHFLDNSTPLKIDSQIMVALSKGNSLFDAFKEGINASLTELQLSIDFFVSTHSLSSLYKINQLIYMLSHGFSLFSDLLSKDELALRDELRYFSDAIHWIDNTCYLQILTSRKNSSQPTDSMSCELNNKLRLMQNEYSDESQVIELLHSERFNNLQLDLLSLLLNKSNESQGRGVQVLSGFAAEQLTKDTNALSNGLAKLPIIKSASSKELYLAVNESINKAILTSSWFSCLFTDSDSNRVKEFNTSLLELKREISELQLVRLLGQQRVNLPTSEKTIVDWLRGRDEQLIIRFEQSRGEYLSMKPYWL